MDELLNSPGVIENVEQMTPDELTWFKELLVSEGIYAKFVRERNESKS